MYRYDYAPATDKPVMHLAHANGFPPEVYHELVAHFTDDYQVFTFPARPLWQPAPDYKAFNSWRMMGDDLIDALDSQGLKNVIGVGHSMGGTATLFAALKRPDLFSKLIMLDPVLFPAKLTLMMTIIPRGLPHPEIPLVEKALRRKREWDSADEAYERFRSRSLFKQWSDETIRGYIAGITQPKADGDGIELRYTPEWEAQIYRTSMYSTRGWWNWIKQVKVPTAAIQGEVTDTFLPDAVKLWKKQRPDFTVEILAGQGHLFPIDAPDDTATMMKGLLAQLSN